MHFSWEAIASLVGMLTLVSSWDQVVRGNVCEEVGGMGIGNGSASGEVGRAIYASYMERVIGGVEATCSSAWEIEKNGEVEGRE